MPDRDIKVASGLCCACEIALRRTAQFTTDCPDDDTTSDHRPVLAAFELGDGEVTPKQQILERIEAIESELESLKRLVEELEGG
jgi:hypothetical protein